MRQAFSVKEGRGPKVKKAGAVAMGPEMYPGLYSGLYRSDRTGREASPSPRLEYRARRKLPRHRALCREKIGLSSNWRPEVRRFFLAFPAFWGCLMRAWRAIPVFSGRVVLGAIAAFFLSAALVPAARAETAETAETVSFLDFLQNFRQEALEQGIPEAVLEATLDKIREPHAQTLARFNRQVEFTTDFSDYLQNRVRRGRLLRGQKLLKRYEKELTQLEAKYGVSRYILVALWGIESDFGQNKGKFEVIPSLATLGLAGASSCVFSQTAFDLPATCDREPGTSSS